MEHHLNFSTQKSFSVFKVFPSPQKEYFKLNTAEYIHMIQATKIHRVGTYIIK